MFLARAFMNDNKMNDSQSFLVQESFLSKEGEEGGEMFLQLDDNGYLNKGQMHIKATLESDTHKSFLLQIHNKDETIATLKKKIGEKMGSTYEMYKGLRNLQASKIVRKLIINNLQQTILVSNDADQVMVVLSDGEEIFFELESEDLWLQVAFHMYTLDGIPFHTHAIPGNPTPLKQQFSMFDIPPPPKEELLCYGATEVRVDKKDPLELLKLKMQRIAYDLWYQTLKGTDRLYIVEQFDLKTVLEDINPEYRGKSMPSSDELTKNNNTPLAMHGNESDLMKSNILAPALSLSNSPMKSFIPKQSKLFNLDNIKGFSERVVGDVFKYKNRVIMKVVYRSVLSNVQFTKHGLFTLKCNERKGRKQMQKLLDKDASPGASNDSNKSEDEDEESDDEEEEDDPEEELDIFHKTTKKHNLSANSLKQLATPGIGRNSFGEYLAHRKYGHHHNPHNHFNRLSLQQNSDGDDDFGSLALVPRNNQSENDIESNRGICENENKVLMSVTFGLTLLNANPQNKKELITMLNDLYKKHLEHLAFLEKKRREQEEKRLKEIEEQKKKKFTISKGGGFKHDTKTVKQVDKDKKKKGIDIKETPNPQSKDSLFLQIPKDLKKEEQRNGSAQKLSTATMLKQETSGEGKNTFFNRWKKNKNPAITSSTVELKNIAPIQQTVLPLQNGDDNEMLRSKSFGNPLEQQNSAQNNSTGTDAKSKGQGAAAPPSGQKQVLKGSLFNRRESKEVKIVNAEKMHSQKDIQAGKHSFQGNQNTFNAIKKVMSKNDVRIPTIQKEIVDDEALDVVISREYVDGYIEDLQFNKNGKAKQTQVTNLTKKQNLSFNSDERDKAYNLIKIQSPRNNKKKNGILKQFSAEKLQDLQSNNFDDDQDIFKGKLDLVTTSPKLDEKEVTNTANVKLIIDNVKSYATANFDELLKPFVAKIEDITRLREPKMRNFKVVSKLQKIEGKAQEGEDSQVQVDAQGLQAFLDSYFNSFNHLIKNKDDVEHDQAKKKKKEWFSDRCCGFFYITVCMLIITSVILYAVNPYGIVQYVEEYATWFYNEVWVLLFEDHEDKSHSGHLVYEPIIDADELASGFLSQSTV